MEVIDAVTPEGPLTTLPMPMFPGPLAALEPAGQAGTLDWQAAVLIWTEQVSYIVVAKLWICYDIVHYIN
jgi:hypothetical protein